MPTNTIRTSDMTEIVFLMARSIPIVSVSRNGDRVTFAFDDSNGEAGAYMDDFMMGRDQVSAVRFMQERQRALRYIKST